MKKSKHSILSFLNEKSNAQNNLCQNLQRDIKEIIDATLNQTQMSNEDKEMCKQQIKDCLSEYSSAINRLEIGCLIKCEQYFQSHPQQTTNVIPQTSPPIKNSPKAKIKKTPKTSEIFKCYDCDRVFTAKSSLDRHNRNIHSNVDIDDDGDYTPETETNTNTTNKPKRSYQCKECNRKFNSSQALGGHMNCHRRRKSNSSTSPSSKQQQTKKSTKDVNDKDLRECPYCHLWIKYQGFYQHKLMHERQQAKAAMTCKVISKTNEKTDGFDSSESDKSETFKCDECGDFLSSRKDLRNHKLLHSGIRPFKCTECPKAFVLPDRLNTHLLGCHNILPHKCNDCGQRFRKKYDLIHHYNETSCNEEQSELSDQPNNIQNGEQSNDENGYDEVNESEGDNLDIIVLAKDQSKKKEIKCTECGKGFDLRRKMLDHCYKVHGKGKASSRSLTVSPKRTMSTSPHLSSTSSNQRKRKLKLRNKEELTQEIDLNRPLKRRRKVEEIKQEEEEKKVEKLHCTCREPFDANKKMIECNDCKELYHYACQELEEEDTELTHYKCSICVKKDMQSAIRQRQIDQHKSLYNHRV